MLKNVLSHTLTHLYQNATIPPAHNIPNTYGEILFYSVEKLLSKIKIGSEDIFIDFGSGLGKLCSQVFLNTQVKRVIGLEINPILQQQALRVCQQLKTQYPYFFIRRNLQFITQDFLNYPLRDETIAFIGSPCYSQSMLDHLGKKIENSAIHTAMSLRPLRTLTRLKFKKVINVEGSWDSALCYLYE